MQEIKALNGLKISVDWISFTVLEIELVQDVVAWLGYQMSEFTEMPKGGMGYKNMIKLDGYPLTILYHGKEGMGIHVSVSGSSISQLVRVYKAKFASDTPFGKGFEESYEMDATTNEITCLRFLLEDIKFVGHITRIDLAIDDIGSQYYATDKLLKMLQEDRVVSKFRTYRNLEKVAIGGKKKGHTIYLGSRKSDIFLRIYDKALEQEAPYPWVRWEFELKDERAKQMSDILVDNDNIGNLVFGLLNNYMRIINLDNPNRSRCSTEKRWKKFIDGIKALRLYMPGETKTLDDKREWFERQVAPTLAGLIIADGGCLDVITEHFDKYVRRMSNDMLDILSRVSPDWAKHVEGMGVEL